MATVEVAVLGPLEVRIDGNAVPLPGRRPAALLAMLVLARGRVASIDELARGVWGEDLPERVKGSVQTCVARLRRAFGADAIRTAPAGYRLNADVVDTDLERFITLVDRSAEEHVHAAESLDDALELWRGEPLGGLSEWIERNDRPALIERYLSTVEQRVDLWVRTGDHGPAIIRLRPLVERYPLRESLWGRLLTALAGSGRIAEALEQYEVMRAHLADALGVDPSPELRALHLRLMRAGDTEPRSTPSAVGGVAPRQLPAVLPGFVGRDAEMARMDMVVGPDRSHHVVVLHGPGGSGKTALAVHWGHRLAASFPDGQLMVHLRGHGPGEPLGTVAALHHLLRGLGLPDADIPGDVDTASALLRTTVAQRRLLMVLDDVRTAEQVRPLLPGGDNVVVVTSRSGLRGLVAREGAVRVEVGPLPANEAIRLLGRRLNTDAITPLPHDTLGELADLCGNLPVALGIAAERAGRGGAGGVAALLDLLRDPGERLAALRSGGDASADIRAVFDASYQDLDDESATMYRLLGLHTDTTVTGPIAAALMGVDVRTAHDLLDRLDDYHLVEQGAPGWYAMHDLVRDHATDLAQRVDSAANRRSATARARSWYVHTAENAVRAFSANPPRRLTEPPADGVEPQTFTGQHTALAWFADHRRGLRALFDTVLTDGDITAAAEIAALIAAYCDQRGAYDERVALFERLAPMAEVAGIDAVLARCVSARGILHGRRGEHDVALSAFERARQLSVAAGDRDGELRAVYSIASTHELLGRPDIAVPMMERVVAGRLEGSDDAAALQARQKLAQTYRYAGRLGDADAAAAELLRECTATGNRRGAARALDTLAEVALDRGRLDEVERRYAESEAIYAALGVDYEVARVANEVAKAQLASGRPEHARENLRRALDIITALEASDTEELNRADIASALAALRSKEQVGAT